MSWCHWMIRKRLRKILDLAFFFFFNVNICHASSCSWSSNSEAVLQYITEHCCGKILGCMNSLSLSLSQDNIRIRKMRLDLINLKVWTSTLLKSWHYFTGRRSHYSSTFLQQNSAAHCNESWSKGRVCLPAKSCIFRDVKRLIDIIGDTFNFCLVTYIFKWTNQI